MGFGLCESAHLVRLLFRRGASTPTCSLPSGPTQFQLSRPMSSGHHISWSTNHGGNIKSLTLIPILAKKIFGRKKKKEKKKHFISEETKIEKMKQTEKMKNESGVTLKWAIPNPFLARPKIKFHNRKSLFSYSKNFSTICFRFSRLLGRLEKKPKEKTNTGKTFNKKGEKNKKVENKNK